MARPFGDIYALIELLKGCLITRANLKRILLLSFISLFIKGILSNLYIQKFINYSVLNIDGTHTSDGRNRESYKLSFVATAA